jgi:voltage-gated potassium channel
MIALLIGTVMIIFTVAFHALGSSYWLMFVGARIHRPNREGATTHLFFNVMATATVLLLLHAVEAVFWALLYLLLPGRAGLEGLDQALYLSMVTFTTLGYGDVTLSQDWQLLAGMEAMAGITVFGLTTALLYAVVQRAWHVSRHR